MPLPLSSLCADGGYGGSDWSYRRGTVGGMTSRGYGRYGGYGGYDDYCASPPRPQTRKTPFPHALCVFVRLQTAAAATARCAVATAAEDATADTMTTVSINVHGPIPPPPLWSLLVVPHPIADAPPRLALSLSLSRWSCARRWRLGRRWLRLRVRIARPGAPHPCQCQLVIEQEPYREGRRRAWVCGWVGVHARAHTHAPRASSEGALPLASAVLHPQRVFRLMRMGKAMMR